MLYKNEQKSDDTSPEEEEKKIDETVAASFPASDPPAWDGAPEDQGPPKSQITKITQDTNNGRYAILRSHRKGGSMKPALLFTFGIAVISLALNAQAQAESYSAGKYKADGSYTRPYQDRNAGGDDQKAQDLSGRHDVDPYKAEEATGKAPQVISYDGTEGSYVDNRKE